MREIDRIVDEGFSEYDTNGDGVITKDEWKAALKKLNGGQDNDSEELEKVFAELDTDQDGKISKEEYKAYAMKVLGW